MYFNMISNAQIFFSFSQFIHPALKNISALQRGIGAELSDMCYQLKVLSLVTLFLLITLYEKCSVSGIFRVDKFKAM